MRKFGHSCSQMLGRHLILDFYQCTSGTTDSELVDQIIRSAVDKIGATLLSIRVHPFGGEREKAGYTAVAVLSESHLAIHTWPENGYVGIDIFTCGQDVHPESGIEVLRQFFKPGSVAQQLIERSQQLPTHVESRFNGTLHVKEGDRE